MFRLESYITPILLSHVAKYVKNIRPEDAQVYLWEGEVNFHNLDLRLDVLKQELNLPIDLISGHIHDLSIIVPWTKIRSEPVRIIIKTIEFVAKFKTDDANNVSSQSSPQRDAPDSPRSSGDEQQQAIINAQASNQSVISGLVQRIIDNISVECHNIILKFVEDEIVISMNVQLLKYGSASEQWKYGMIDVHPVKVLSRKLIQISDLTICLDKRNEAGQIEVCHEPVLYRCSFEIRLLRKYNANNNPKENCMTRLGIFTKSLDINISSLQLPMALRLLNLILLFKSEQQNTKSCYNLEAESEYVPSGTEARNSANNAGSYLSWAWSLLPSFGGETAEDNEDTLNSNGGFDIQGFIIDFGVYIEEMHITLKNSELIQDTFMGGIKRIRYSPILRLSFGGLYAESANNESKNWSCLKAGLSSMQLEPLGSFTWGEAESQAFLVTERVGGSVFGQ